MAAHDKMSVRAFLQGVCDVLSFRRLLAVNDVLWIGEWIFHVSFVLVILRHLRYFLDPVPPCIWSVQTPGIIAGYLLPLTAMYIFVEKYLVEKKKYVSHYNSLLLGIISFISVSGLLMKTVYHPDVVSIKTFIISAVTFRFAPVPGSSFFILHVIFVLALLVILPTHIFAAPLVLLGARQREENLNRVIHEK
ncbi:MAG: hypothetical protein FIA94_09655 [Nitrospirae bacterium]|nr:hypothetical protein [Nitrospirota bacterium]